jgi:hypothetical protein
MVYRGSVASVAPVCSLALIEWKLRQEYSQPDNDIESSSVRCQMSALCFTRFENALAICRYKATHS